MQHDIIQDVLVYIYLHFFTKKKYFSIYMYICIRKNMEMWNNRTKPLSDSFNEILSVA